MLRATTACTFSTSQLPKVVRTWCVSYIFTSKCASRHNGVHFFISHLARCLRTRRFSEPTFRPSGATNHWKNTVNRDFQCFTHLHLLSSDLFSSELSLLSDSSLLCFSSFHIVGSLASKLPSTISYHSIFYYPFLVILGPLDFPAALAARILDPGQTWHWRSHSSWASWARHGRHGGIKQWEASTIWVCLKMVSTPKPNSFADHYPY